MENVNEVILELPWSVVDECNGFGLDFGGSVCKVIYLHNDDWAEPDKRTKDTVPLRCVNISRTEFDQALDYLKARVCIRRKHPGHKPSVFTSGVGGAQYAKEIQQAFDVQTTNVTEFECFLAGVNFILRHNTRGEVLHELNQDSIKWAHTKSERRPDIQRMFRRNLNVCWNVLRTFRFFMYPLGVGKIRDQVKSIAAMMKDAGNMETTVMDPASISSPLEAPFQAEKKLLDYENLFPFFLVMIGSNGGVFVVKEDGTYRMAADLKRAGRTFLGLASILSKSKSYAEIMSKAERGNMRQVHEYIKDLSGKIDDDEESMYGELSKSEESGFGETPAFIFGKTVFKDFDQFSSEDLGTSLLYLMVSDIIQMVHTANRIFPQVKHVLFSGGFPNHPLTREKMVTEWLERDGLGFSLYEQTDFTNLHFLKHGSHLGALGAYLNPHLKFKDVPETTAE